MKTLIGNLKASWKILKGKLKQRYADLADDDLMYVEGQEEEMVGRIAKRTFIPRHRPGFPDAH